MSGDQLEPGELCVAKEAPLVLLFIRRVEAVGEDGQIVTVPYCPNTAIFGNPFPSQKCSGFRHVTPEKFSQLIDEQVGGAKVASTSQIVPVDPVSQRPTRLVRSFR